jgi:hypothetical protein
MTPELNREYPEFDDPTIFEEMTKLTVEHMKPIGGRIGRGQHLRSTACVKAEFRVSDGIPAELRHGIFQEIGRTYSAIVRLSNSQGTPEKDGVGTARGMAVKLLNVPGARAVPGDTDTTQDFVMIDHPVFPFPDPKAYFETVSRKDIRLIGDFAAFVHMALSDPKELKILKAIRGKHVASPLEVQYWSGAAYWLGPGTGDEGHAVKYTVIPRLSNVTPPPEHPEDLPADYLTQAAKSRLSAGEVVFDFAVQLQTDPVAMPVEDVSVEWDETSSKPVVLARILIPQQTVNPDGDFAAQCERMSFNPWHSLASHRPLGGMNRLRRVVYAASVAKRAGGESVATEAGRK